MTKNEQALHDFRELTRSSFASVVALAKRQGIAVDADTLKDRDAGGLAHMIIRDQYGERTYRAMRRELFKR